MNRRRFLKYAGATGAVGLAGFGGGILVEPYVRPVREVVRTVTSTATVTMNSVSTVTTTLSPYMNKNGDFCSGEAFWHPWDNVAELGYETSLPDTKWGYAIENCQYGKLWIDNPNLRLWDHCGLAQWTAEYPPPSQWALSDNDMTLEAEVMIPEADSLHTSDPERSWSRVAIAFQLEKKDGSSYVFGTNKFAKLYSEFDVYRHNAEYFYAPGSNVREYHADQLPIGVFRKYRISLNDFFLSGHGSREGWGRDFYDESRLDSYYLVVEVQSAKASAAWRNVRVY